MEEKVSEQLVAQRLRNRAIEQLESLAEGDAYVQHWGFNNYFNDFDFLVSDPVIWPNSAMTPDEHDALAVVYVMMDAASLETPPLMADDAFVATGWPQRVAETAQNALAVFNVRGRSNEDEEEAGGARNRKKEPLKNREDAHALLVTLRAPERLLRHLHLVGEAADILIDGLRDMRMDFDANLVRLGVAVHDAGKIVRPEELDGPGSVHEVAGQSLMLAHGVQPEIAKCCVSHAAWQGPDVRFEERVVALADKLWKGKREESLELLVIDAVAARLGVARWDVFMACDGLFEMVAAGSADRLSRS